VKHFDVIVVGAGHAGVEAAAAAARVGVQVALVTMRQSNIGMMSCNPAIGGLGKGHLVREIDALDGLMAQAADRGGIQFRLLNRSKGPAVQGPRAQQDRRLFQSAMQELVAGVDGLTVVEGEVVALRIDAGRVIGIGLADGTEVGAHAVVLCTGTFLGGVLHVGDVRAPGGRVDEAPAVRIASQLREVATGVGRLKTGTPPRLDGRTIAWDRLEMQPGDEEPVMFSFLPGDPLPRQLSCGITHTSECTHDIIRANLHRSAMYGGHIEGVGPRYCPSIEDKVVRFSDKASHQIFLEPEGLEDPTVYPNGISTSLPADAQEELVRSIPGLERAVITQPGYAIEYDYLDPRGLSLALELRQLPGLFLAGQINGTTGYEEAGAQGLVAGLNAARSALGQPPVTFSRAQSYIGVMIDDLTSHGVTEPYRMFTSRSEYRLSLRADNADQRLTPIGIAAGCVGQGRTVAFGDKSEALEQGRAVLQGVTFSPHVLAQAGIRVREDGERRSAYRLLSDPAVDWATVAALDPRLSELPATIRDQLAKDALYASLIERQRTDAAALQRDEAVVIPVAFDYRMISGLSTELTVKLERIRPETLAQAGRIEGMTPAALTLILAWVRKGQRMRAAS